MEEINPHIGSSLDDFLREDGIYEEIVARARDKVLAWQKENKAVTTMMYTETQAYRALIANAFVKMEQGETPSIFIDPQYLAGGDYSSSNRVEVTSSWELTPDEAMHILEGVRLLQNHSFVMIRTSSWSKRLKEIEDQYQAQKAFTLSPMVYYQPGSWSKGDLGPHMGVLATSDSVYGDHRPAQSHLRKAELVLTQVVDSALIARCEAAKKVDNSFTIYHYYPEGGLPHAIKTALDAIHGPGGYLVVKGSSNAK